MQTFNLNTINKPIISDVNTRVYHYLKCSSDLNLPCFISDGFLSNYYNSNHSILLLHLLNYSFSNFQYFWQVNLVLKSSPMCRKDNDTSNNN